MHITTISTYCKKFKKIAKNNKYVMVLPQHPTKYKTFILNLNITS